MDIIKLEQKKEIIYWNNSDYHKMNTEEKKFRFLGIPIYCKKRYFTSEQGKDVFNSGINKSTGFNK